MSAPPVVVLDNGSGYLKAGLSNESQPRCTIPALIGRPMLRYGEEIEGVELKEIMIGDEVIPVRSMLELTYPISEGIVQNPDDLALLWKYCLTQKLDVRENDFRNRKVLITEAPSNPTKNKVKMGEILLEKMNVGGFNVEPQAMLTLYSEGLESGIVLDSGDGVSHCIPIISSFIMQHFIGRLNIAGRHITNNFIKLLQLK